MQLFLMHSERQKKKKAAYGELADSGAACSFIARIQMNEYQETWNICSV